MLLEQVWGERSPSEQFAGAKQLQVCGKVGDIERFGPFSIANFSGEIVREFTFDSNGVVVDFGDGTTLTFSRDEPVYYEPWFMDRGSYLVRYNETWAKLATEFDRLSGA